MKKQLLLLTLSLFLTSFTLNSSEINAEATQEAKVAICTGSSSKRYHKTNNCSGLNACKGERKFITLKEAQDIGRTPCKICYK